MIFTSKEKVLKQAKEFLNKGLFYQGFQLLNKNKNSFLLLSKSNFLNKEYLFLFGAFLANTGNYKKAIIFLKKSILSLNEHKPETLSYLVKSYSSLEDYKKAKFYLNKLIDRSYNYPFYFFFSYYEYFKKNKDLLIPIDSLKDILSELSSDSILDKLSYALYYLLSNKAENAYKLLKPLQNIYYDNYNFNLIFLKILFSLRKYHEIIKYFNENLKYLESIEIIDIYSATLYKLGFYDQCQRVLNDLIFLQKSLVRPIINLGKIDLKNKKYTQAIEKFKSALRNAKNKKYKDQIYFLLSVAYYKIGLLNDAVNYIFKISEGSQSFQKAFFNSALINYDLGQYKTAKEFFKKIDINKIFLKNYEKWKKRIINNRIKPDLLKILITLLPWLILIFACIILLIFYLFLKK